ncbi:hypothetical protein GCM10011297_29640 [Bacterioplanes sanyensis]|uniref:DinB family protein n=1 Tax=Bacterioplanes sanyensis TaxID=1249553 RepID=UPI001678722E|nr:DinB family protein [Bacterioplanes sanyensis]GGY54870.1 hypothetical protein GCM10011297_29640 [Bacterioplanes sanyensis]
MPWSDHYRRSARYNRWMNAQLLNASLSLPSEQQQQDVGLAHGSLCGCWNHLLATDLLWLRRLQPIYPMLEELNDLPPVKNDRQLCYPQLKELQPVRERIDDVLQRWCDLLRQDDARAVLVYGDDDELSVGLDRILQHLFNHHTHYRGQISAVLQQLGQPTIEPDLLHAPLD